MRRVITTGLIGLFFTVLLIVEHRYSDPYAIMNLKFWVIFLLPWAAGLGLTIAGLWMVSKILKLSLRSWTGQYVRALVFGVLMVSLFLGYVTHHLVSLKLADFFFHDHLTVIRIRTADTFGMLLSWCIFGGILYICYRIAEVVRVRKMPIDKSKVERKEIFFLAAKLCVAGVLTIFLIMLISGAEWIRMGQFAVNPVKMENSEHSVFRIVTLESSGISHRTYLKALAHLCEKLHDAGVKVVVAPLPVNLAYSGQNALWMEQIIRYGNVVFAVPPEEKNKEMFPEPTVQSPLENKVHCVWGVISAEKTALIYYQYEKYFPFSYRDLSAGLRVPDVAVEAAARFQEIENTEIVLKEKSFVLREYHTGLMKDQSALIRYRINPMYPFPYEYLQTYVKLNDSTDEVMFGMSGPNGLVTSNPSDSLWHQLAGTLVIIEPGDEITKMRGFWYTYSNIINGILENDKTLPLDTWTPWVTAFILLITLSILIFLKPWIAMISVVGFVIGQGYLYIWLASRFGLIVEFLPPIIGTLLGFFIFSFVLIAHERKRLERNEKKRIVEELKAAHDMQMGLMPTSDPIVPGFDISGLCRPAFEVGGDYFDYIWLDEEKTKFGIAIADVSGKAMKAAMTAVMTSGMIYREISNQESPRTILRRINRPMYLKTDRRIFTAMSFAVIDIRSKSFTFSNAGQMAPLLRRGNILQSIKVDGPRLPLGIQEEVEYNEVSLPLQAGDMLFLFTDGIVEAKNSKEDLWGFNRMEQAVKNLPQTMMAKEMGEALIEEANKFAGTAMQHDDMTIVVVKVN